VAVKINVQLPLYVTVDGSDTMSRDFTSQIGPKQHKRFTRSHLPGWLVASVDVHILLGMLLCTVIELHTVCAGFGAYRYEAQTEVTVLLQ
jgi:hypothetical protein